MVLPKPTKDTNKAIIVLKFAYGMKNSSKVSRKQVDLSGRQKDYTSRAPIESNCSKQIKGHQNGKRLSLTDHKDGGCVELTTNRTRRSITHSESLVDNMPASLTSVDSQTSQKSASNGTMLHKRASNGTVLHVSPTGKHNKHNGLTMQHPTNHSTENYLNKSDKASKVNTKGGNTESIGEITKEVESLPLSGDPKDIRGKFDPNGKPCEQPLETVNDNCNILCSHDSLTEDKPSPEITRPFLSRLSTESRISDSTSTSLLSNNSKSSRKSLAEKIQERRVDLQKAELQNPRNSIQKSRYDSASVVSGSKKEADSHYHTLLETSVDVSTGGSTDSVDDTNPDSLPSISGTPEIDSIVKKTKHCPDVIPVMGENSKPIHRRRRSRRILTTD